MSELSGVMTHIVVLNQSDLGKQCLPADASFPIITVTCTVIFLNFGTPINN